jgi:hypothetical protein
MFLNQLNEEEKINFIKLAYVVATKDGDYSKEEKKILVQYASEMGIELNINMFKNLEQEDLLIQSFNNSSSEVVKKIFIELIGLVLIDQEYQKEEDEIMRLVSGKLYSIDLGKQKSIVFGR